MPLLPLLCMTEIVCLHTRKCGGRERREAGKGPGPDSNRGEALSQHVALISRVSHELVTRLNVNTLSRTEL